MIVLGLTGGVGAGKSTVLKRLREAHGAYTIQADEVGHFLMQKGNACYQPVINLLGESILDDTGKIDRKKVGGIVFSNKKLLLKLNGIIHPAVKEYIYGQMEEQRKKGCRLFVVEAALLLEEHYDEICDDLWYIYVDDAVRRRRLKRQRGYSDEKIDSILGNQLEDGVFRLNCSYIIENNGDLTKTYQQIDKRVKSYEFM